MRHAPKGFSHRTRYKFHPALSSRFPCFSSPFFLFISFHFFCFRSRALSLSFDLARSSPPFEPPALPCRSGSPRHRCNVSCRARAHLRETCFETRDTPTRSTQPRYVGDSFSLSLFLSRQRSGISAATAAAVKGSATKRVARRRPRRPWRLPPVSPMNRSRVATCVLARARA